MYTKRNLIKDLEKLQINRKGTLLVHSSMKSIGPVEGGADTVLDALMEYMKEGLLVFPTHTWWTVTPENPYYYVDRSPSCVGILTELFRKRPGVVRSRHPTHSVAAIGKGAEHFVAGDEKYNSPCARGSAWGKLLDHKATILLIGVDHTKNTFIHGVEEWANIPGRLTETQEDFFTVLPDGTEIRVPTRLFVGDVSKHFWKVDAILEKYEAVYKGTFGDATVRVCDAERMAEILFQLLKIAPDLFSQNEPIRQEVLEKFKESDH